MQPYTIIRYRHAYKSLHRHASINSRTHLCTRSEQPLLVVEPSLSPGLPLTAMVEGGGLKLTTQALVLLPLPHLPCLCPSTAARCADQWG